ncbi:MAG: sigma-70 family RNA polymerase sigma factor [Ruminococcaceae bacterium]|nr:sigma-70 family RNA polymerase sigma factor [Oscillospiraceae bacterium]
MDIEILTEYVVKAKQGDSDAFTTVFQLTKDYVYSAACALLKNETEAQDVVQEVYLKVWLHLGSLREERSFLRWIHSITFNICQDHLQQHTQDGKLIYVISEEAKLQKTTFDEWFQKSWLQDTIREMIDALPNEQKEAVYLFYFQDRSVGEIAVIQDCPINTVKSRLFYARNTLEKLIEAEEKRTGQMHLSPAVLALTSVMMLPVLQTTLPQADAIRILSAVFAAAGMAANDIHIFNADGDDLKEKEKPHFKERIHSFFRRHWIIGLRTTAILPALTAALILCICLLGVGFLYGQQQNTSDQPSADELSSSHPLSDIPKEDVPAIPERIVPQEEPIQTAAVIASGMCGEDATYQLTEDGTFTVSGTGRVGVTDVWNYDLLRERKEEQSIFRLEELAPYKELVTALIVEEGITGIGYSAFSYMPNLETVVLPDSCTQIEAGAFMECIKLTEFVFPPHVKYLEDVILRNCTALRRVVLPEDAEDIRSEVFNGCVSMEEVLFTGNKLRTIRSLSFANLPSLHKLQLPDSLELICSYALFGVGLKTLDLSGLKQVSIQSRAIEECHELTTLILPDTLTTVPTMVIRNCDNLSSVVIGKQTKRISTKAFITDKITEITIPESVQSIANGAFSGLSLLTAIYVDDENPVYCDLDGVLYKRGLETIHTYPRARQEASYTLPEATHTVVGMAFSNNKYLNMLILRNGNLIFEDTALTSLQNLEGLYFFGGFPMIWRANSIVNCPGMIIYGPESGIDMIGETWAAEDGNVYPVQALNHSNT